MSARETHEPDVPINWPTGHVLVEREPRRADRSKRVQPTDIRVTITEPEANECILVSLAGYDHFLHSTTARALDDQLRVNDGHPVSITIHGVTQTAGLTASTALRQALEGRLTEWNEIAVASGVAPV